jgi:hypothetical protein
VNVRGRAVVLVGRCVVFVLSLLLLRGSVWWSVEVAALASCVDAERDCELAAMSVGDR